MGYFLGDLMYPSWSIFAKKINTLHTVEEGRYYNRKEVIKKDIERFFGVAQSRWKVSMYESHFWYREDIVVMSKVTAIFHNTLLEW